MKGKKMVYVVTGFKKDKATGYSLPCYLEVFDNPESAQRDAVAFKEGWAIVTSKEVRE